MKRTLFCLFFFAFLSLPGKAQRDKAIYERYCTAVKEKAALPTGDLMVETARFFLGTPYVAGTLEEEPETLVINLLGLHDFGREYGCFGLVCQASSRI